MSLILITHDLALVAEAAHRIIVMYAGQVVEEGRAEDIFREPKHPYTQALLRSLPEFAEGKSRLQSLPGVVPGKYDRPQGCLLNPRCPYATDLCRSVEPELRQIGNRQVKCHTPLKCPRRTKQCLMSHKKMHHCLNAIGLKEILSCQKKGCLLKHSK